MRLWRRFYSLVGEIWHWQHQSKQELIVRIIRRKFAESWSKVFTTGYSMQLFRRQCLFLTRNPLSSSNQIKSQNYLCLQCLMVFKCSLQALTRYWLLLTSSCLEIHCNTFNRFDFSRELFSEENLAWMYLRLLTRSARLKHKLSMSWYFGQFLWLSINTSDSPADGKFQVFRKILLLMDLHFVSVCTSESSWLEKIREKRCLSMRERRTRRS